MPFSLEETCLSFGETFFSLENFLFFASCFEFSNECYVYLPFFFHFMAASTLLFAAKLFL